MTGFRTELMLRCTWHNPSVLLTRLPFRACLAVLAAEGRARITHTIDRMTRRGLRTIAFSYEDLDVLERDDVRLS